MKFKLAIPMAHAAGDPNGRRVPRIMERYRSGGTPWAVIIDPAGTVVYNGFHIDADRAKALMDRLMAETPGRVGRHPLPDDDTVS